MHFRELNSLWAVTLPRAFLSVLFYNSDPPQLLFFVSEYCLRPQLALLTVPAEEARTMVSPQPAAPGNPAGPGGPGFARVQC
jgi:hypothetical protein